MSFFSINRRLFYPNWKSDTCGCRALQEGSLCPLPILWVDLCKCKPEPVHATNQRECKWMMMIYLNIFRGGCKAVNFKIVGNNTNLILALMYWSLQKALNTYTHAIILLQLNLQTKKNKTVLLSLIMSCHVWKNEIKLQKLCTSTSPLPWKCACQTDRSAIFARRPHSFIVRLRKTTEMDLKINSYFLAFLVSGLSVSPYFSLYVFALPRAQLDCVATTANLPWQDADSGSADGCETLLAFCLFFASCCRDGDRLIRSLFVCVQTRLVPLYYGFQIITMHLGDLCHCVCGISHSV